jgi:endonuclease/exonuclease/phosphatase family metal-dependent hydrolase
MPRPAAVTLPVPLVLGFAALLELTLQLLRAFFPLGYHLVGSLGFVVTPLLLVGVFVAPLLYPALRRLLGRRLLVALAGAVVAWRLVVQVEPVLVTAAVGVVLGLLALAALLPVAAGHRFGPDAIAAGTLVGLGIDVALRAWRATDDVVWSSGWQAWFDPSLLVPVVMLLATLRWLRTDGEATAPAWTWAVLLMPVLLLWGSLAFVGSSGGVSLAAATLTLLGATVAGMALLAWPRARVPWVAPAVLLLVAALGMPRLAGWPVLVLAVAATATMPLLVREAAARAALRAWSPWRHAAAFSGGAVTMFVLLLLYPLHYEIPLPVSNAWLPGIGVAMACLPLLRRPAQRTVAREFATPSRVHGPALVGGAVGTVALAGLVHVGMVGGSPLPGPDPSLAVDGASTDELRVASYNVGQGQDAQTGALAFRDVAEQIVALDADVVALQEVARGWPLTSMADLDAYLRAHTDLTLVYVPAADRQFGNALAARVPLDDVTALDLGQGGGAQRRSAVRATLPEQGDVRVYGAHLQARNTPAAEQTRGEQMQLLLDDWDGRPRTVLAGDLNPRNEYADASETPPKVISNLDVLLDGGLVTQQPTALCTEPTSNDNCSDYVFVSPDLAASTVTEVVDVDVSDHRPVLARIGLPGQPRQ